MTERVPPPLLGFNNNLRYRGLSFHIQTEDSGLERPHIITHLFVDGGRIIKTLRVDYSEHVNGPDYRSVVQRMMRDQHRAMAYDLRQGRIDPIIDGLTPPGMDEATRARPAAAGPGVHRERHEPTPPLSAEPTPLPSTDAVSLVTALVADEQAGRKPTSRVRRSAGVVPGCAGGELGCYFVALPPSSLDELILSYVAGARGDGQGGRLRSAHERDPIDDPGSEPLAR